ncbi:semaphorin-4C, partial [Brachionus plicatilis]
SNEIDSAVCMFELSSVKRSMSGLFKNDQDKSPRKPLSSCADYKKLTPTQIDTYTKNISRHSKFEMDESLNRRAFLALKNTKFTSIAIDSKAKEHIVYIGTENGRLLKVINRPSNVKGHTRPIILSDVPIFDKESVVDIKVSDGVITLIGQSQIKKVNVEYFCQSLNTCTNCVLPEDPDCAWTVNGCALTKLGYEQKKCLISHYDFIVADKKSPVLHQTTKFSSIFITFLFTFFPTCILTCLITFYIIKNNYKLIEKNETDGDKRLVDFFKSRNFRPTVAVKKKLLNCYETQPVVCINSRPDSASDSPFILTSCSSTSTESNSPNYSNKNNTFTQDKQFKDSNLIRIC